MKKGGWEIEDSKDDKERKIIDDAGKLVKCDDMKLRRQKTQENFKYYMREKGDVQCKACIGFSK